MSDLPAKPPTEEPAVTPGYVLNTSDRTAAAMQLATYYTAEAMRWSATTDPRARLAEQLSYFDLAFRSIMSSTARTMIKSTTNELDQDSRPRAATNEFRTG
jgi:hypothetical protein